ncbi:CPBP family intramembrane glutamic endopeptidase [Candidatus Tisiphia endosymbiont of Nemotelus uliginosus]|uniref:CPBP family intramembrane glutamic endopeptidase n=1 Tax=Candidatus Tisiphia endosymbiont of Nemotelus uliginosus TaxID=3077926 RepID=UPI0035C8F76C
MWILCCALQAHLIPGFNNLLVLNAVQFTPDAKPYTMYLNFDKAVVGLIILGTTLKLVNSWQEWKILFKQIMYELPIIVPAIILIIILSIIFNYIKFELKFPQLLWIWGINNLFFTCIAEEALWRGFVQESLTKFKYQYSEYIALLISAIFFGLAHFPGGGKYVLLATIAGVLYGWVYKVTKRIEASILTHFTLNLVHILFFTYPALKLFYKALTVCG